MFSGSTSISSDMIRVKYPIEYELEPDTLEIGIEWIKLRLKNVGGHIFAQFRYKNAFY